MKLFTRRHFIGLTLGLPFVAQASTTDGFSSRNLSGDGAPDLIETLLTRAPVPRHTDELWVLVDDKEAALSIYRGNVLMERFAPISLGRGGAKTQRMRGDNATPMGEFRVDRFNHASQWHIFIGIDYPTPTHAQMALQTGLYTQQDYDQYFDFYRRHRSPPQDTVLGGAIGIHGLGKADPDIHDRFHWTQGCVALTNSQIERLTELVDIGTRVVIR